MGGQREPLGAAGEVRVVLRDLRHRERHGERGEREVDALQPQCRQADDHAGAEPDEGGDR